MVLLGQPALPEFLRLGTTEPVPDHPRLSTRSTWIPARSSRPRSSRPGRHRDPAGHDRGGRDQPGSGRRGPTAEDPSELVADKGYHSRDRLKDLEGGPWKGRIAEKRSAGVNRWRGDEQARRAVYNNGARLRWGVAKEAFKLRAELVEHSFAPVLDRGGMRRTWLRGRDNLRRRHLAHVAGYDLGLIMRLLVGAGTPRAFLACASAHLPAPRAGRRYRARHSRRPDWLPKLRCSPSASSPTRTTEAGFHQRSDSGTNLAYGPEGYIRLGFAE